MPNKYWSLLLLLGQATESSCFRRPQTLDQRQMGTQKEVKREWGRARSSALTAILGAEGLSTEINSHSQSLLVLWEEEQIQGDPWQNRWIWVLPSLFLWSGPRSPWNIHRKPDRGPEKRAKQAVRDVRHHGKPTHFSPFPRLKNVFLKTMDIATSTTEHQKQPICLIVGYYLKKWCYACQIE